MNTKIHKIFGMTLALMLVFSLAGAFLPANQAGAQSPGTNPNTWQGVSIPTTAVEKLGAYNVTDMAVAGDGTIVLRIIKVSVLLGKYEFNASAHCRVGLRYLAVHQTPYRQTSHTHTW